MVSWIFKSPLLLWFITINPASAFVHREHEEEVYVQPTTTTTNRPIPHHPEGSQHLPEIYLPKDRKATSAIFSPMGSVIPIVGDAVFHIYLDIDTPRNIYEQIKRLNNSLNPVKMKTMEEKMGVIETILQKSLRREKRSVFSRKFYIFTFITQIKKNY